jgi:hypothetical protein
MLLRDRHGLNLCASELPSDDLDICVARAGTRALFIRRCGNQSGDSRCAAGVDRLNPITQKHDSRGTRNELTGMPPRAPRNLHARRDARAQIIQQAAVKRTSLPCTKQSKLARTVSMT